MNTTGFKSFGLFNFSLQSRNAAKRLKKVETDASTHISTCVIFATHAHMPGKNVSREIQLSQLCSFSSGIKE